MLTDGQIYTEMLKQFNWLNNEVKQKEFLVVVTNRCEVYKKDNTFTFMGNGWVLPEQFTFEFTVTNDHIERGDEKCSRALVHMTTIFQFNRENFNLN